MTPLRPKTLCSHGDRQGIVKAHPLARAPLRTARSRRLKEITERLKHIETGLAHDRARSSSHYPSHSDGPKPSILLAVPPEDPRGYGRNGSHDLPRESNPLQILEKTVEQIDIMSQLPDISGSGGHEMGEANPAMPDAIQRGLVTIEDCEAAFVFFHDRLEPWILCCGEPEDRVLTRVRSKSPFLFHVMLLITNCTLSCSS